MIVLLTPPPTPLLLFVSKQPSTLIIQFRHQMDVGGAYWSANVVVNQIFCFVAVFLYGQYSTETKLISQETLFLVVTGLCIFSMLNFAIFLKLINKKYYHTFFNMQTGQEFLCETWRTGKTDKERFYVFSKHRSYYKRIDKEIQLWLKENWENWEESSPEWFIAKTIAKIPDELLPSEVYARMGGAKGRRGSAAAMIKAEEEAKKKVKEKGNKKKVGVGAAQVVPAG